MLELKRDAKFPRASGLRTTEGSTLLRTGRGPLGADQVCVQSVVQCVEDRGWRLPPVPLPGADADVFAQREHLSLSWIQPVHTYCSRDALHRFEIRAPRSLVLAQHTALHFTTGSTVARQLQLGRWHPTIHVSFTPQIFSNIPTIFLLHILQAVPGHF